MTNQPSYRVRQPRTLFLFFITLLFLFTASQAKNTGYSFTVVKKTAKQMRINVVFNKPQLHTTGPITRAEIAGGVYFPVAGRLQLPAIVEKINMPGRNLKLKIIKQETHSIPLPNMSVPRTAQEVVNTSPQVRYIGKYRDFSLFALSVFPVRINSQGTGLLWVKEMTIDIFSDKKTNSQPISSADKVSPFVDDTKMYPTSGQTITAQSASKTLFKPYDFGTPYKLYVQKTGIYKITYDQLFDVDYPVDTIDPKRLALINHGKEIPIYFKGSEDGRFDPSDYFEFYGEKNEKAFLQKYADVYADPFSDVNVYWLVEKPSAGERLVEESGAVIEKNNYVIPFKYKDVLHVEKNNHRELFGKTPEKLDRPAYEMDHWFWGNVISAVESREFEFHLPYPFETGASVFVNAMLRGVSIYDSRTNPIIGHQVAVWLNDQKVGEILPQKRWLDQTMATINNYNQAGLAQSNLHFGTNKLRIDMDQPGFTDIVLLNWFDLTYNRRYRADQNYIKFHLQEGLFKTDRVVQFEIDGFTDPDIDIYKLGISKIQNGQVSFFQAEDKLNSYKISIQDNIFDPKTEYVAVGENAKLKPVSIKAYKYWKPDDKAASLFNKSNLADLLIITGDVFLQQAERLKALKQEMGYNVEIVSVDQIYDLFNFGIKSPLAIKDFIKYAYRSWDQSDPLKYVILIGDASYRANVENRPETDIVPTIMFVTHSYGAAPADIEYTLLSGDDLVPDIAIGRIPASDSEELTNYLDKVEAYQKNPHIGQWRNKALMISGFDAGGADRETLTNKPIFRSQNNRIIDLKMPQDVFAFKLNSEKNDTIQGFDPDFGSTRELIDYFDEGVTFINFFGHGGGAIWADEGLFKLNDVDNLNNENLYPFISSMTCFTGAFENPNREGLAEKMLLAKDKGAIAVLASSSVGWKYNDFAVSWALHDYLWDDAVSFGDAINFMKIDYLINPVYYTENGKTTTPSHSELIYSMVNQYNLLGDPTLLLQKPNGSITVTPETTIPQAGQTIKVALKTPMSSGAATVEVSDVNNVKLFSKVFPISAGEASFDYPVPAGRSGQNLKIKVYAQNGSDDASGHSIIAVSSSILSTIQTTPRIPLVNTPISFSLTLKSFAHVSTVELRNFRDFNFSGSLGIKIPMMRINDSTYQSENPFPGFSTEGLKYYEVVIRDENGAERKYDLQKINVVDNRPNLTIDEQSLGYLGNDLLQFKFDVVNTADAFLSGALVQAFVDSGIASGTPFYSTQVSLNSMETKTLQVPITSIKYKPVHQFKIIVDKNNDIVERNENDNILQRNLKTDKIWIKHDLGTSVDGVTNDSLSVSSYWTLYLAPNAVSASTVLDVIPENIFTYLQNSEQKDLKFIRLFGQTDSSALRINVDNAVTTFTKPLTLHARLDTLILSPTELQYVSFFRFDSYLGLWVKSPTVVHKSGLETSIDHSGLYGVFSFKDQKAPVIEITANGRPLRDNMLVRSKPALAILLQDENGIDLSNHFSIKVDGTDFDSNELTLPDSITNPNAISLLLTPEFEKGAHNLEIETADINGNIQAVSKAFLVSSDNDLVVHGNYPNPFEQTTIISYTNSFTGPLDDLAIKIYTVSGHLVRSKQLHAPDNVQTDEKLLDTGYHEVEWDGIDDGGNEVANGVYFVTIRARYTEKITGKKFDITKKIKVARLR